MTLVAAEPSEQNAFSSVPHRLIQQLGDPVFATRLRATDELWKLGQAAQPALQTALRNSEDLETVERAKKILQKFEWGIYPDTPSQTLKLIKDYRSGEGERQIQAITRLLILGGKNIHTLGCLLDHELEPGARARFYRHLMVRTRDLVPHLLFHGEQTQAEHILELGTYGPEPEAWLDYAVFMAQHKKLKVAIEKMRSAAGRDTTRGHSSAAVLAVLYLLDGQPQQAVAQVQSLSGVELPQHFRTSVLVEAEAWQQLLEQSDPDENAGDFGMKLFRTRQVGDRKGASQLIADARLRAEESHPEVASEIGRALLLNGAADDGIAVLKQTGPHSRLLADVLSAKMEFSEVLALLPKQPESRTSRYGRGESRSDLFTQIRRARVLGQIGEKESSIAVFKQIAKRIPSHDSFLIRELLRAELKVGREDLAAQHAGTILDSLERREEDFTISAELFECLFDEDAESARAWWRTFRTIAPFRDEDPGLSMQRTRQIIQGRFDSQLVILAKAALLELQDRYQKPSGSPIDRMRIARALAGLARQQGDLDECEQMLRLAIDEWTAGQTEDEQGRPAERRTLIDNPNQGPKSWVYDTDETGRVWFELGDLCLERGRLHDAVKVYEDGWKRYPNNPMFIYLSGRAILATGDAAEGQRRIRLAHQIPLGDAQIRGRFLHELTDRGYLTDCQIARDATRQTVWYRTRMRGNVWNQLVRTAVLLGDYTSAAKMTERNLHYLLASPNIVFVEGSGYLTVPTHVIEYQAQAALAAGNHTLAYQLAQDTLRHLPGHTDLLAALVTRFEKQGHQTEADQLFEPAWDNIQKLLAKYPDSAWLHATAATMAAGSLRQLEPALAHAQRAVELEPNVICHQKVLAEVHFRRGERAQAIEIIERLQKQDWRSWYYKAMIHRYRSGERTSPMPLAPEEN